MNTKPIVLKTVDMTQEQLDKRQEVWLRYVDKFCPPIDDCGTRRCDLGVLCDKCHYDYEILKGYVLTLVAQGLPISPYQYNAYIVED